MRDPKFSGVVGIAYCRKAPGFFVGGRAQLCTAVAAVKNFL